MFDKVMTSNRLSLRRLRYSDKKRILEILMSNEIIEGIGIEKSMRNSDYIFTQMIQGIEFVIEEKVSKKVIGSIGIVSESKDHRWLEVGFEIEKTCWGCGFATEALKTFVTYVFTSTNYIRIEASIFDDNDRSKRVLKKNGFKHEGTLKSRLLINNRFRDYDIFALVKENA